MISYISDSWVGNKVHYIPKNKNKVREGYG